MVKKRGMLQVARWYGTPQFVFLVVLFLCGGLTGSLTGIRAAQQSQDVAQFQLPAGTWWLLCSSLLAVVLWQVAVLLAGWMRLPTLFVGMVLAARGFSIAFSQGALLQQEGWKGMLFAFCTSGVSALICVPCLLLTGAIVLQAGQQRTAGRGYCYMLGRDRLVLLWCFGVSLLGGCLRLPAVLVLRLWMGA